MNLIKKTTLVLFLILITACTDENKVKIVVDDIKSTCDISCFRGVERSDLYYEDLVKIVGEPNDIIERVIDDEIERNPTYYYKEGKITCYWTGNLNSPIGLIEYTPYRTSDIGIEKFIKSPNRYNIPLETEVVAIFKEDTLYYLVYLDSLKIETIEFWETKKRFFNVGGMYD